MGSDRGQADSGPRGGPGLPASGGTAAHQQPPKAPSPCGSPAGASAAEAAGLLMLVMEMLQDPAVEEGLAVVDARFGGALASWEPPWAAEDAAGLTLEGLSRLPGPRVIESAEAFASSLASLSRSTEVEGFVPEADGDSITVVMPEELTEWQLEVVRLLVRLTGGECVCQAEWAARSLASSVLPCATRIVHLRSLEAPAATVAAGPSAAPPAPPRDWPDPRDLRGAAVLRPGFLLGAGLPARAEDGAVPTPQPTPAEVGGPRQPAPARGAVPSRLAPCIQFIHLQSLHIAMNLLGEAAALIMGSMQLMRHACLQQALAALDDISGGLVTSWQPPWSAELFEEVTVEQLSRYPESTLIGWAMNVDAFVSFLARFAAAGMKGGWVPGVGYPSCPRPQVEELDAGGSPRRGGAGAGAASPPVAEPGSPRLGPREAPAPPGSASPGPAPSEAVQVEVEEDEDGWEAEDSPLASAASAVQPTAAAEGAAEPEPQGASAIVAVLPDVATRWHLDVLGALVSSLGVYMISERAWRADFAGESNVPFEVGVPTDQARERGDGPSAPRAA